MELEITLGGEIFLKSRPSLTWTVSYMEGNKLYCFRAGADAQVSSIVVDASMVIACEPPKGRKM